VPDRIPFRRTSEDLGKPLLIEVVEERRHSVGTSLVVQARLRLTNQTGVPIRVESYALRAAAPPAPADEDAVRQEVDAARDRLEPALERSLLEPDEPVVGWVVHGFGRPNYGTPRWTIEIVDAEGVSHRREVSAG
jgi:hypothetical protein